MIPNFALAWLVAGVLLLSAPLMRAADPYVLTEQDRGLLARCEATSQQFDKHGLLLHDTNLEQHLRKLAEPIRPEAEPEGVKWRFLVMRDSTINAFALPNGSIFLTSGLLGRLENDDQLIGVLAYEVTHVVNRDLFRAIAAFRARRTRRWLMGVGVSALFGVASLPAIQALNNSMLEVTLTGYGDEPEQDADRAAVRFMNRSNRDSAQLTSAYERFANAPDVQAAPTFYTDRELLAQRIAFARSITGRPAQSSETSDSYRKATRAALLQNVRLSILDRAYREALAEAESLVKQDPSDAMAQEALGEALFALGPRDAQGDLTKKQRKQDRDDKINLTAEEQRRELAATTEGRAALADHQQRAVQAFERAIALDANLADAHRGLAFVHQDANRRDLALAEYAAYLKLVPYAPDKARIERRIASTSHH